MTKIYTICVFLPQFGLYFQTQFIDRFITESGHREQHFLCSRLTVVDRNGWVC